ncbi:sugar phosphate nucleotidyltransferase [Schinkia azotoformans]|uniref:sugar phosphate nucleotidyltransferase n=1 Tax=Schinkia azotoformans TaxID=1454 RepID=UPI002E1C4D1A|nr:sugar phosphate nucleotidyltransferase [Schinkia azotoformans]MED4350951.1 sugar phosphate nucleotidyltransferase [Schinkia azotoformans]
MRIILLSGGSGQRLWPLSNDARAKQFLKVFKNEYGEMESMVQRVWSQLGEVGVASNAVIATGKSQIDLLHSQLGEDVPIVLEPERRDTFPAIALASSFLYTKQRINEEETVVVLAVDPYAQKNFFERIKEMGKVLEQTGADITLLGVKPTFPSAKYGYIVPKQEFKDYIEVSHFVEKPDEERASSLIKEGSLWNCGVFAFRLKYILDILKKMHLPIDYDELYIRYNQLPIISFDYQIVEKASKLVALSYSGEWKDLGTWNTLTEEMGDSVIGNGQLSEDSVNSHIINELDISVKVLGLSNTVVAVSSDGILVSDKIASARLKEMLNGQKQRPMYEERRWGWYRVLDYTKLENGKEVLTKRIGITAGKNLSYQIHEKRREVWTIISGKGEFVLDGILKKVKPGDVLEIPIGAKHAIRAVEDLEFIEVQMGSELVEEDIIRITLVWEEIFENRN